MKSENQLYLVLKKQYFLEILAGTKKEEYRDFTEYFIKKFCTFDQNGEINGCKKYDTVRFQMGYQRNAPQLVVDCEELYIAQDATVPEAEMTPEDLWFVIALGAIREQTNCFNEPVVSV